MERNLSNTNVPLDTYLNAILHQQISNKKIKHQETVGPYILFVDEDNIVSVWSCRLFPVKLFQFWAGIEDVEFAKTHLTVDEKEMNMVHM